MSDDGYKTPSEDLPSEAEAEVEKEKTEEEKEKGSEGLGVEAIADPDTPRPPVLETNGTTPRLDGAVDLPVETEAVEVEKAKEDEKEEAKEAETEKTTENEEAPLQASLHQQQSQRLRLKLLLPPLHLQQYPHRPRSRVAQRPEQPAPPPTRDHRLPPEVEPPFRARLLIATQRLFAPAQILPLLLLLRRQHRTLWKSRTRTPLSRSPARQQQGRQHSADRDTLRESRWI